jgi:hypothetical protein
MTLMTAAARYSPTARAPTTARNAIASTPTRPWRRLATIVENEYAAPAQPQANHATFPADPAPVR